MATSKLLMVMACGHVPIADRVAPPDPPDTVVNPSANCCVRTEQVYDAHEETPFGAVESRLASLGRLQCDLAYADGTRSKLTIHAEAPQQVRFVAADVDASSCQNLCFSELQAQARITVLSADGRVNESGVVSLRELEEAGAGLSFTWEVDDKLIVRGSLRANAPNLSVEQRRGRDLEPVLIAEAVAPCVVLE